jgi:DNA-binding XRE family transcriptional regulator
LGALAHAGEQKGSGRRFRLKLRTLGRTSTWVGWVNKKALEARLSRWRRAFASVLAACRRDADLTQWQVAEEMGWTRNTVTKIEGGDRPIASEELMELCRLYRVDPIVLMGRVLKW